MSKLDPIMNFLDTPPVYNYEERVLAFIDVLGWRKIVEDSVNNFDLLQNMTSILDLVRDMNKTSRYHVEHDPDLDMTQVIHFSDTIVISSRPERLYDFFSYLHDLVHSFLMSQFFVRGGVTIGKIVHKDSLVLGPALNKAYDLESKQAKYPRILVDPDYVTIFQDFFTKDGYTNGVEIDKFEDDLHFFCFYRPRPFEKKGESFELSVADMVLSHFLKYKTERLSPDAITKINWFIRYYNYCLDKYPASKLEGGPVSKLPMI